MHYWSEEDAYYPYPEQNSYSFQSTPMYSSTTPNTTPWPQHDPYVDHHVPYHTPSYPSHQPPLPSYQPPIESLTLEERIKLVTVSIKQLQEIVHQIKRDNVPFPLESPLDLATKLLTTVREMKKETTESQQKIRWRLTDLDHQLCRVGYKVLVMIETASKNREQLGDEEEELIFEAEMKGGHNVDMVESDTEKANPLNEEIEVEEVLEEHSEIFDTPIDVEDVQIESIEVTLDATIDSPFGEDYVLNELMVMEEEIDMKDIGSDTENTNSLNEDIEIEDVSEEHVEIFETPVDVEDVQIKNIEVTLNDSKDYPLEKDYVWSEFVEMKEVLNKPRCWEEFITMDKADTAESEASFIHKNGIHVPIAEKLLFVPYGRWRDKHIEPG